MAKEEKLKKAEGEAKRLAAAHAATNELRDNLQQQSRTQGGIAAVDLQEVGGCTKLEVHELKE